MTALRRTGPRLALLQAVADGAVRRDLGLGGGDNWVSVGLYGTSRYFGVTARMRQLRDAELVQLGEVAERWSRPWVLTPAGEQTLLDWGGMP